VDFIYVSSIETTLLLIQDMMYAMVLTGTAKGDLILYDELCHATPYVTDSVIRARKHKLIIMILRFEKINSTEILIQLFISFTESVFSMDGDCPNLEELLRFQIHCYLVIDEACMAFWR
jgi:8-amino-7-oxononanoate synthase